MRAAGSKDPPIEGGRAAGATNPEAPPTTPAPARDPLPPGPVPHCGRKAVGCNRPGHQNHTELPDKIGKDPASAATVLLVGVRATGEAPSMDASRSRPSSSGAWPWWERLGMRAWWSWSAKCRLILRPPSVSAARVSRAVARRGPLLARCPADSPTRRASRRHADLAWRETRERSPVPSSPHADSRFWPQATAAPERSRAWRLRGVVARRASWEESASSVDGPGGAPPRRRLPAAAVLPQQPAHERAFKAWALRGAS